MEKRLAPVVNDTIFIESKNYYCEQIRAAQTKMNEENERLQKANWTLLLAPDNAEAKETYKDAKQKYLAASAEAEAERERGSLVLRYKQAKNELEQAKYDEKTINEEAAEKFNTLNEEIVQNKQRKKEVQAVLEKVTGTSRPTRS